jgi:hypothetical protein
VEWDSSVSLTLELFAIKCQTVDRTTDPSGNLPSFGKLFLTVPAKLFRATPMKN